MQVIALSSLRSSLLSIGLGSLLATTGSAQSGIVDSVKWSATSGGLSGGIDHYDQFGSSLAALGDLDGDGIDDVAVGAYFHDGNQIFEGEVFVLFLNADGTVRAFQEIATGSGGLQTVLDGRDHFGCSVEALGDLDGDGLLELAVGAYGDDDGDFDAGAVYVLSLASNGTVHSEAKISQTAGGFLGDLDPFDRFGWSLELLGDLDGDGLVEVAVGSEGDDDGIPETGAVWILSLTPSLQVASHVKISATSGGFTGALGTEDAFGSGIAAIGDLDGDGFDDLVVGAHTDQEQSGSLIYTGAIWVLFLNADGTVRDQVELDASEPALGGNVDIYAFFGSDVDRYANAPNGARRVLVGASGADALWILTLASDGSLTNAREISGRVGGLPAGAGGNLGTSVLYLGDRDQDGFPEILAGATDDSDGGSSSGAAWLFTLGTPATQVTRNGAGVNPLCFTGSGPPTLGTLWTGTIDATVNPSAGLTIVAGRTDPTSGIFVPAGEVLVDIFTGGFVLDAFLTSSGSTDFVMLGVPNDLSLDGFAFHLQAAVLGGGSAVLCNALDVVLGS